MADLNSAFMGYQPPNPENKKVKEFDVDHKFINIEGKNFIGFMLNRETKAYKYKLVASDTNEVASQAEVKGNNELIVCECKPETTYFLELTAKISTSMETSTTEVKPKIVGLEPPNWRYAKTSQWNELTGSDTKKSTDSTPKTVTLYRFIFPENPKVPQSVSDVLKFAADRGNVSNWRDSGTIPISERRHCTTCGMPCMFGSACIEHPCEACGAKTKCQVRTEKQVPFEPVIPVEPAAFMPTTIDTTGLFPTATSATLPPTVIAPSCTTIPVTTTQPTASSDRKEFENWLYGMLKPTDLNPLPNHPNDPRNPPSTTTIPVMTITPPDTTIPLSARDTQLDILGTSIKPEGPKPVLAANHRELVEQGNTYRIPAENEPDGLSGTNLADVDFQGPNNLDKSNQQLFYTIGSDEDVIAYLNRYNKSYIAITPEENMISTTLPDPPIECMIYKGIPASHYGMLSSFGGVIIIHINEINSTELKHLKDLENKLNKVIKELPLNFIDFFPTVNKGYPANIYHKCPLGHPLRKTDSNYKISIDSTETVERWTCYTCDPYGVKWGFYVNDVFRWFEEQKEEKQQEELVGKTEKEINVNIQNLKKHNDEKEQFLKALDDEKQKIRDEHFPELAGKTDEEINNEFILPDQTNQEESERTSHNSEDSTNYNAEIKNEHG